MLCFSTHTRYRQQRVVISYANTRPHFKLSDDYSELPAEVIDRNPPFFRRMIGRDLGLSELGPKGGILFAGAKNGAQVSKHVREEEEVPELDSYARMARAEKEVGVASS